jgi:hypothetical protein
MTKIAVYPSTKFCTGVLGVLQEKNTKFPNFIRGFYRMKKKACQASLVDTGTAMYITPLHSKLAHGEHRLPTL